jgi:hypothetical protein
MNAPADPCPRCGGMPAAPRVPTARNPFLPREKRLTCSLCGLVYDKGAAAWQPGSTDPDDDARTSDGSDER